MQKEEKQRKKSKYVLEENKSVRWNYFWKEVSFQKNYLTL